MRPLFSSASGLVLIALLGCAHAPDARPGPAPAPQPPPVEAGARTAPAAPAAPTAPAVPAAPSGRLDPSEEITPEELASIPEPVPGRSSEPVAQATGQATPGEAGPEPSPGGSKVTAPEPAPDASSATGPAGGAGSPSGVWRVQVFASPDRAQADRIGREASERLGAPYVLEREGDLVKVRLGSFAREEDAQALRERAVRNGYSGAFRVLVRRAG